MKTLCLEPLKSLRNENYKISVAIHWEHNYVQTVGLQIPFSLRSSGTFILLYVKSVSSLWSVLGSFLLIPKKYVYHVTFFV
jgi:hypothetical protein